MTSLQRSPFPVGRNTKYERISDTLDGILAALGIALLLRAAMLLSRGIPLHNILFFDADLIWEILEGTGIAALLGRGAMWGYKKLKGGDKYQPAIFRILDKSPQPLTEEQIKSGTRPLVGESRDAVFDKRFDEAFLAMRNARKIKKVVIDDVVCYTLNEDSDGKKAA